MGVQSAGNPAVSQPSPPDQPLPPPDPVLLVLEVAEGHTVRLNRRKGNTSKVVQLTVNANQIVLLNGIPI